MQLDIQRMIIFIVFSLALSLLLMPLRHPSFNTIPFNCIALFLEIGCFWWLTKRARFQMDFRSAATLALTGLVISAVTFAFTSILLDRYGISGLRTSTTHSGYPNYVLNIVFFSFFSYCWIQFPLAFAFQTFYSRRWHPKR